jgi:hypothetical protein
VRSFDMARISPRRRRVATLVAVTALALGLVASCTSDDEGGSGGGDPDLFCDAAREAFAGDREFDFGDPAQRQQILDVFDRMVEYAPDEIDGEVEATRDAVVAYAEKATELDELQSELDASEGETLPEDAVAELQELVAEIEDDEELVQARESITPYLLDTCAVDIDAGGGATTTAPGAATLESTTTTAAP